MTYDKRILSIHSERNCRDIQKRQKGALTTHHIMSRITRTTQTKPQFLKQINNHASARRFFHKKIQ